jgi:hypothetical protein
MVVSSQGFGLVSKFVDVVEACPNKAARPSHYFFFQRKSTHRIVYLQIPMHMFSACVGFPS